MRRLLALIAGDRRGAAAAEFAMVLPVVGGMIIGALDFAHAWQTRLQLEQAAQAGIELVAARKGVGDSYTYALNEAVARWGRPLTSSAVDSWLECGSVRQGSINGTCNGAQRARYVSIRLTAEFVPLMGWGWFFDGATANNGFIIVGDGVVRVQ